MTFNSQDYKNEFLPTVLSMLQLWVDNSVKGKALFDLADTMNMNDPQYPEVCEKVHANIQLLDEIQAEIEKFDESLMSRFYEIGLEYSAQRAKIFEADQIYIDWQGDIFTGEALIAVGAERSSHYLVILDDEQRTVMSVYNDKLGTWLRVERQKDCSVRNIVNMTINQRLRKEGLLKSKAKSRKRSRSGAPSKRFNYAEAVAKRDIA